MSSAIRFSLPFKSLRFSCDQHYPKSAFRRASLATKHDVCSRKIDLNGGYDRIKALTSHSEEGSVQGLESSLASVKLEPISSESQFDRVVAEAQQLEESVVIVWTRFYCLDVNNVPHKLVVRAGVTKMPTIQLWKDGKKQAEVIGGHKAYLVVNEVQEMIENESTVNIIVFTGTSDI
ncbi:thioredoxin-like 3-2, chloroplastic isoform X4 [Camellia sinensis]|uniref:thioredoxin-like 3-2, chloroplastic isoform X4 n=1 Tax=Camellia sinensis TaxID=4442 RepID=UPI0010362AC9|nr:thioredoxin-like 3-2, chloroplastic isoform X4 [Camellia sinensis]